MKKTLFILFCLLAFGLTSNAQTSVELGEFNIGISAGSGISTAWSPDDTDPIANLHGGVSFTYLARENFFYEFDLLFQRKGYKQVIDMFDYTSTQTFNAYYMELPITANTLLIMSEKFNAGITAGVYFAYGVGGKVKVEQKAVANGFLNALEDAFSEAGMDVEFETDDEAGVSANSEYDFFGEDGAKRFDFGFRYGFTFGFFERLRLTLALDHGFLNNYRGKSGPICRNIALMGTLSFYFR